ncbi:hypothetical protein JQR88_25495 (plasmid) [Pseudomonas luteola]|uniref:hypothetical protein n=1 Tax=Pseudomonas luteola TaxID=47886 RepID=UPI003DA12066
MQKLTLQERHLCFVKAAKTSRFMAFLIILAAVLTEIIRQLSGVETTADMMESFAQAIFFFGGIAAFAECGRIYIESRLQAET